MSKIDNCFAKEKIPKHMAFIVDGNGRWALKRGLKRHDGHKAGLDAVKRVVDRCFERGVGTVSLFCFSTENFKRPKEEVEYLFDLFRSMGDMAESFIKRDASFHVMGDLSLLPNDICEVMNDLTKKTSHCKSHVINFGIAYGARREIVSAVNKLIKDGVDVVDEKTFASYLYTAGLPDPDIIVRSSGEQRLSNFMLYQAAYSEFYFPKKFWPDFNEKTVDRCIKVYQKRKRRFGAI